MKAELTNENKEKFFAKYWKQGLINVRIDDGEDKVGYDLTDWVWKSFPQDCYLSLKPLSSISDEDAIEVGNILTLSYDDKVISIEVRDWISDQFGIGKINHKWDCMRVQDFLRSRGYALSWMGLSTEEMVAAGWIKLTE